jgi:dienelactone hydrolase
MKWVMAVLVTAAASLATAAAPEAPLYPDRADLLKLRDAAGKETRITTLKGWAKRREHILANMQKVMGTLPGLEKRTRLDIRIESETETDAYLRMKIHYTSAPGERVPAYLLIPKKRKGTLPAVLALHQTVQIGKDEPVGLGGKPDLWYGKELAERGYVVLAPDYPTLGEHEIDIYARGWQSGSMKAIWDNMRGLDVLESLPSVDPKRIGALGHSLGGHNTLFTAAFDTRIRALVSNCGFCSFSKYYGGDISGWTGPRYMPRIKTQFPTPDKMPFDFQDVVAAIAPRAFLAIAPERDSNFAVAGVREVIDAAAPVYSLFGKTERLKALYPDCEHEWPKPMREEAYKWLDRWLKPRPK